jgi:hypothetical protein
VQRKAFHERVLEELLQERLACRRGRRNPRSIKRKMSNWPLRPRHREPLPRIAINDAIRIIK